MSKPRVRITGAMPLDMRNHFRDAIEFFANYLMTPQMVRNINIHLRYKHLLERGTVGECELMTDSLNPRRFKITISPKSDNRMNRTEIFQTLAHEMIHVKQYAYRQLKYDVRRVEKTKWKGRYIDPQKVKYEKLPWEKEAFRGESFLFAEYVCHSESFEYFFG